jgi:hypothetical protein
VYHLSFFNMKTFSGPVRFVWRQSRHGVVFPLALVVGVAIFASGCSKKESPAPAAINTVTNTPDPAQPTTQNAVTPRAAPANPGPAQINLAASANAEPEVPALQQLNRAVVGFRMQYHRSPNSVEEVASASGIQLPAPPPGKKYAFNSRGFVALVESSAK